VLPALCILLGSDIKHPSMKCFPFSTEYKIHLCLSTLAKCIHTKTKNYKINISGEAILADINQFINTGTCNLIKYN